MNNFDNVFTSIKEHGAEALRNKECFRDLKKIISCDKNRFPVDLYLEVLEEMGLIKFNKRTKEIALTEKGKQTNKVF